MSPLPPMPSNARTISDIAMLTGRPRRRCGLCCAGDVGSFCGTVLGSCPGLHSGESCAASCVCKLGRGESAGGLDGCTMRDDGSDLQACSKALANACTLAKRRFVSLASAVITTSSTSGEIAETLVRRDGGETYRC